MGEVNDATQTEFWEQARLYKAKGLSRGMAFKLLIAIPRYRQVLMSMGLHAASVYNRLRKEVYVQGAPTILHDDAWRFVQAGEYMHRHGNGFFR
jgi:hypothetical protein